MLSQFYLTIGIEVRLEEVTHSRPKPFRFFNCWSEHAEFLPIVQRVWQQRVEGSTMFQISQKLKRLKGELKIFNKETFIPSLKESLELENELREVQRMDNEDQNGLEELESKLYKKKVHKTKLIEEDAERQKSRMLWLEKGVLNTYFFHRKAKTKRGINTIDKL